MSDPDTEHRHAVALFRYGLIDEFIHLEPGSGLNVRCPARQYQTSGTCPVRCDAGVGGMAGKPATSPRMQRTVLQTCLAPGRSQTAGGFFVRGQDEDDVQQRPVAGLLTAGDQQRAVAVADELADGSAGKWRELDRIQELGARARCHGYQHTSTHIQERAQERVRG